MNLGFSSISEPAERQIQKSEKFQHNSFIASSTGSEKVLGPNDKMDFQLLLVTNRINSLSHNRDAK